MSIHQALFDIHRHGREFHFCYRAVQLGFFENNFNVKMDSYKHEIRIKCSTTTFVNPFQIRYRLRVKPFNMAEGFKDSKAFFDT